MAPPRRRVAPRDTSFERYAVLYDAAASPFTVPLFALALRRLGPLPAAARVLDLGCGPGRELCTLAARPEVVEAVGIDSSPTMCDLVRRRAARRGLSGVTAVHADAADLPGQMDGTFDLVLASLAHHHFSEPELVARSAHRVLRASGRYCIVDHGPRAANAMLSPLAAVADPGWTGYFAPDELAGLLLVVGFCRVRWSSLAPGIGITIAERAA